MKTIPTKTAQELMDHAMSEYATAVSFKSTGLKIEDVELDEEMVPVHSINTWNVNGTYKNENHFRIRCDERLGESYELYINGQFMGMCSEIESFKWFIEMGSRKKVK